jgi:hypothetical protein
VAVPSRCIDLCDPDTTIRTGDDLIAYLVDEHGEQYVVDNWESKIEHASVVLNLPEKEEFPFYDGG